MALTAISCASLSLIDAAKWSKISKSKASLNFVEIFDTNSRTSLSSWDKLSSFDVRRVTNIEASPGDIPNDCSPI